MCIMLIRDATSLNNIQFKKKMQFQKQNKKLKNIFKLDP